MGRGFGSLSLRAVLQSILIILCLSALTRPSLAAVDRTKPYWNTMTPTGVVFEAQGDSPGVGKAVADEYTQWMGKTSTSCNFYPGTVPVAICFVGNVSWGSAGLVCPISYGYWYVGDGCALKEELNQPVSCEAIAANPVVVGTGAKSETVTDYSTAGSKPLAFTRLYFSNIRLSGRPNSGPTPRDTSRFGRGWRSPFDSSIVFTNNTPASVANGDRAHVALQESRELVFRYNSTLSKWQSTFFNGSWTGTRTDIDIAFAIVGSEARLTYKNGDVWAYGLNGRLTEIRYKSGYVQTLSYTGTNNTSITDNLGRSLTFTYDTRNLLTSMTTPDGKVYKYTYEDLFPSVPTSGEFALSTVIYPDSTPGTDADNPKTTYHYEDTLTRHARKRPAVAALR